MNVNDLLSLVPMVASTTLYLTMTSSFTRALASLDPTPEPAVWPSIAVLRPLAGADDQLEANFEALADQDAPPFEILLGVASPDDPALAAATAFRDRHPELDVRVVLTRTGNCRNPKVAQLLDMELLTSADVLVISDSNTRVHGTWLKELVVELTRRPRVGMVSSLVRGTGERSFGAAMENLQLCVGVAAGIAAVQSLTGHSLAVGKSMALSRRALQSIGGLRRAGDHLAEDHLLGRWMTDSGWVVRTCLHAIDNVNVRCDLSRTVERHTRWARMRRRVTPWGSGLALEPLLNPMVPAAVAAGLHPTALTAGALCFAVVFQVLGAALSLRALRRDEPVWRLAVLEPLRVALALWCWARAWASDRVSWRGHSFRVGHMTALEEVPTGRWLPAIPSWRRAPRRRGATAEREAA